MSRSILVVEDNDSSAEPLLRLLEFAGHRPNWARNGREALEMLPAVQPDLVILDMMMPEMDGYEFLQRMRNDEEGRGVQVIVLTGMGPPQLDRRRLQGLGVVEVLLKGAVDYHRLLHRLGSSGPAT